MFFFQNLTEIYPFFSLLFSLILFLGLYQIGELIFLNKKIKLIFLNISELKYQKILVAVNFLMIALYPVVLFFEYSKYVLNFSSILIFIFGIFRLLTILKKKWSFATRIPKLNIEIIFYIAVLGYFFITFSPVNHADSLDYHLSAAHHISQSGKIPTTLENFHNLLVGVGEVFASLGINFGSEQFGTLVQFSGLISLLGVIKKFSKNKYFFSLLILSSPVIIFLASSPKPQLFHICSNAIVFVLLFINYSAAKDNKNSAFHTVLLVNIFLINSINAKFSFILSAFVLYNLLLIFSYKKYFLKQMIFFSIFYLSVFYFDVLYWKSIVWGGNFFDYIFNPFPDVEGVEYFKNYLINYKRSTSLIYLFIPKSLGEYTDAMGIGCLLLLFFASGKEKKFYYFIPIVLFFILINYLYGQPSARFFIELYIWMILLLSSSKNINIPNKFMMIFYPQFLLSFLAIWYGVVTMSYGFLNSNLRDHVMSKTANGYSLFSWSNSLVQPADTVISMHRSVALGKTRTLSTSFLYYLNTDGTTKDSILYSYHLKNFLSTNTGSTYLLTLGDKTNIGIFSKCIDYLYEEKKNAGKHTGRNPFNSQSNYNGYLYKLKDFKKTKCLKYKEKQQQQQQQQLNSR